MHPRYADAYPAGNGTDRIHEGRGHRYDRVTHVQQVGTATATRANTHPREPESPLNVGPVMHRTHCCTWWRIRDRSRDRYDENLLRLAVSGAPLGTGTDSTQAHHSSCETAPQLVERLGVTLWDPYRTPDLRQPKPPSPREDLLLQRHLNPEACNDTGTGWVYILFYFFFF